MLIGALSCRQGLFVPLNGGRFLAGSCAGLPHVRYHSTWHNVRGAVKKKLTGFLRIIVTFDQLHSPFTRDANPCRKLLYTYVYTK